VLDDVAIRAVLEQPAGKHSPPLVAAMIEHDQLDKSSGFLRRFPLRGAFAGAQPHDRAADADAFTRLQRQIAHQAVALVEQTKQRHPIRHRGDTSINIVCTRRRLRLGDRGIVGGWWRRRFTLSLATGQCQRGKPRQYQCSGPHGHAASGVHA
jgi:hypothetical protein